MVGPSAEPAGRGAGLPPIPPPAEEQQSRCGASSGPFYPEDVTALPQVGGFCFSANSTPAAATLNGTLGHRAGSSSLRPFDPAGTLGSLRD